MVVAPFTEKNEDIFLKMAPHGGGVVIKAVHADGSPRTGGNICYISDLGISLYHDVDPSIGFQLDKDGRLAQIFDRSAH